MPTVTLRRTVRRLSGASSREDDVDAAERLLSLIARSRDLSQRAAAGQPGNSNRSVALEQAQIALALRQRRVRFFEGSFSAEPPFTLLLALYANQDREPVMTYTRLIQLAWVSSGTAARWLDRLAEDGWIERTDHLEDQRRIFMSLTAKARKALDDLFSWPERQRGGPQLAASSFQLSTAGHFIVAARPRCVGGRANDMRADRAGQLLQIVLVGRQLEPLVRSAFKQVAPYALGLRRARVRHDQRVPEAPADTARKARGAFRPVRPIGRIVPPTAGGPLRS